jgi:hypothetical protein
MLTAQMIAVTLRVIWTGILNRVCLGSISTFLAVTQACAL